MPLLYSTGVFSVCKWELLSETCSIRPIPDPAEQVQPEGLLPVLRITPPSDCACEQLQSPYESSAGQRDEARPRTLQLLHSYGQRPVCIEQDRWFLHERN